MKQRANKLDPFKERLREWEAAGKTLMQMQTELQADGCRCALSSIGDYLARMRQEDMERSLFAMIATGGRMNRELDAAFEKNPEPDVERLIQVTKTLIMSLQVQGTANPKMLGLANSMQMTVLSYLSGKTKAALEARKLELSESKYRDLVAEKKRAIEAELAKAKSTGGISKETMEKIEQELKLF